MWRNIWKYGCHVMLIPLATLVLLGLGQCSGEPRRTRNHDSEAAPIASTPLGKYQGSILKNSFDKPIFAFRGIRYAEPPVGELRFKPGVPVKKHDDIQDATKDAPACPQPPVGTEAISEDCLFLNVYTTKLPSENEKPKRPVLVIIHTGDFESLSSRSDLIGPTYSLNRDIVLVTFNYRLGVLGFISTGDKEAPGNLGLKDQVEVLKWVKHNIESFGGDPNLVTIFGAASSAACVNLHMVSPLSKGLFHRAIMTTGSIAGVYPIGKNLLKLTKKQAKVVGCPDGPSKSLVDCLKTKSADTLGKSLTKLHPGRSGRITWKPVIEEDFGQERFLTDHPVKLMVEGKFHKVPLIIGYNSDEFTDDAIRIVQNAKELENLDKEWKKEAPELFLYSHDKERSDLISQDLRSFYFGDKKIDSTALPELTKIFNDALAGYEINRAVKLIAQKSDKPVFFYYFTIRGKYSFFNPKEGPIPEGPVLYDDIIYITPITAMFPVIKKDDPEFPEVLTLATIIETFAKTGKPPTSLSDKVQWEPFNLQTQKYLENSKKGVCIKEKLHFKRFAEWEKLFPLTKYSIVRDASD